MNAFTLVAERLRVLLRYYLCRLRASIHGNAQHTATAVSAFADNEGWQRLVQRHQYLKIKDPTQPLGLAWTTSQM